MDRADLDLVAGFAHRERCDGPADQLRASRWRSHYERAPGGDEHDWGGITAWEPPRRLGYLWHLRADRADATDVEITFVPVDAGRTRVEIEHRGWERLGAAGEERRDRNRGGWAGLLPHFIEAAEEPAATAEEDA